VVRAILVIVVVVSPSVLLPGTTAEAAQATMLVALTLGVVVGLEYAARAPALIAFRDAPPVNRMRILSLFATLICLSTIIRYDGASTAGLILNALGLLVGQALDLPFSPVRLLIEQAPDTATLAELQQLRIMAGLAIFLSIGAAALFVLLIRLRHWPNRGAAFNVWINLPTFDPTTGRDVVERLSRDGLVNILLSLLLPFFLPVLAGLAARQLGVVPFGSAHAMVWGVSLWMFLPLGLFMRGVAMRRVAEIIRTRRARLLAPLDLDAPRQLV
jgi:hypothetical protein